MGFVKAFSKLAGSTKKKLISAITEEIYIAFAGFSLLVHSRYSSFHGESFFFFLIVELRGRIQLG